MKKKHTPHFRIILRKNHFWISEPLGVILIFASVCGFIMMSGIVFVNDYTLRKNMKIANQNASDSVMATHYLNELSEKQQIAAVLDIFTKKKLPVKTLWLLSEEVYNNSIVYGYDPFLVLAVIHVESMFKPNANGQYRDGSPSQAYGFMQLRLETAQEVGAAMGIIITKKEDLFVPEINIALGVAYLTQQISRFKSLKLGILAYNQGPGIIENTIKDKTGLSILYYNKVIKNYFALKKMARKEKTS